MQYNKAASVLLAGRVISTSTAFSLLELLSLCSSNPRNIDTTPARMTAVMMIQELPLRHGFDFRKATVLLPYLGARVQFYLLELRLRKARSMEIKQQ